MLKQNSVQTKIVDMRLGYEIKDPLEILDEFKPDIVGLSIISLGYMAAYELVNKIKPHGSCMVVAGGPHVSSIRSKVLSEMSADFAIKGEGEYTLLELCKSIEAGADNYAQIRGLIWRSGSDIIENPDRPYIQDLDELPYPAYEEFELEKYTSYVERVLPIITSRGCPYGCIFCSVRLSMGNRFRARTPKNVVDEIEHWYNKGWATFDINDDCFSFDINRAIEICDLIIERKLKISYKLYNGLRVDRVNKDLLKKMKESGCTFIQYGIESGNDEVLKTIRKGITLEVAKKAVEITNEVGIENAANFIVGHPGENLNRALDSVQFAEALPTNFTPFYNLVPYPGSELFEWVEKNATFLTPSETYLNEVSYGQNNPIFETKEFSKDERRKALTKGFRLYRKKVLRQRLGRVAGYIAYLFARYDTLWNWGANAFLGSKTGKKVLKFLNGLL